MQAAGAPNWSFGLLTDVGRQRQGGVNQDAALALDLPHGGLFAVADGMGGHAAGELAATLALDALSQHYLARRTPPPIRLAEAVQDANVAVLRHAVGEYVGMGTTLIAALIDRGALLIAHVGDSRAYLLRGGELFRLTEDHSWVSEQVRLGHLTEEEAREHQWRSVVSNALGGEERVRLELFGLRLRAGDRVMLCSDGLSSVVKDTDLLKLLVRPLAPDATARLLVDAANDAGGPDNITVLVIDVRQDLKLPIYDLPPPTTGAGLRGRAARHAARQQHDHLPAADDRLLHAAGRHAAAGPASGAGRHRHGPAAGHPGGSAAGAGSPGQPPAASAQRGPGAWGSSGASVHLPAVPHRHPDG
ncbi:PP2C family protein-serine/threonine phosphatase [Deinococcus radiopugnans]|uniref:PP2C family protein-serine/threonine phosphatase n=1 Tax=Deinococcus radiopugnans TaxID=57497 RepID=UPI00360845DD